MLPQMEGERIGKVLTQLCALQLGRTAAISDGDCPNLTDGLVSNQPLIIDLIEPLHQG